MKLSIVIPAYNEEQTIETIIRRAQAVDLGGLQREIIVVNDGSQDGTERKLKDMPGILYISHAFNAGKGAALRTGLKAASGDIVLIQDADLEYDPEDYRAVITPILDGKCETVMGSRFLRNRLVFFGKDRSPYLSHYLGNQVIVFITNLLYRKHFTDYEGCYKAFTRPALESVVVRARGFEFDNELICKLMRKGVRIVEVPIRYSPRTYKDGKKINWKHGVIMLWTIMKCRVLPM